MSFSQLLIEVLALPFQKNLSRCPYIFLLNSSQVMWYDISNPHYVMNAVGFFLEKNKPQTHLQSLKLFLRLLLFFGPFRLVIIIRIK